MEVYDSILIGNNLVVYMAAIYNETSNSKQLIIKTKHEKDTIFDGYDRIPGVLDVKDNLDLLTKLEQQAVNLGCSLVEDEVTKIKKKDELFEIITEDKKYYSKTLVLDNAIYNIKAEGCFDCYKNINIKEAIILTSNGCKISFAIREYLSELNNKK